MRTRGIRKGRVARVQVGEVGDPVRPQGTANAGMLRPAVHAALEEGAIDDQLMAAREQVEQAHFTVGPVEHIRLFRGNTTGGVFMGCCSSFRPFSGDAVVVIAISELERSVESSR